MEAGPLGTVIGSSDHEVRQVRFGILDRTVVPFTSGVVLGEIPNQKRAWSLGGRT